MKSIPKIYTLGTRFNADIFDGPIVIEEKIDGSQFSFGAVAYNCGLRLVCRSKSTEIDLTNPGMFAAAVETAKRLFGDMKLPAGWVFQCEYLQRPKHNVLAYARIPSNHLVLFDVRLSSGDYLPPIEKAIWAQDLGLEVVTQLAFRKFTQFDFPAARDELMATQSVLGGTQIEGIVIKNYSKSHPESESGHAPMTAKVVSDRFKEKMVCRPQNPKAGPGEFVQALVNSLRTEARWLKAIQHLKEANQLQNDNRDIGPLCREIQRDVLEEESDWLKQQLFDEFSKDVARGVVQGFAQFYQKLLVEGPSVWQDSKINENQLD